MGEAGRADAVDRSGTFDTELCIVWGDPHITSFGYSRGGRTPGVEYYDLQDIGVYQLMNDPLGHMEVQAFQCPWGRP